MQITVTCLPGLEEILAEEINRHGGQEIDIKRRAVLCTGDLRILYKLNLECRYALRVLLHLEHHHIKNEEELYQAVHSIHWQNHFEVNQTFAIRSAFGRHDFRNTHYFSLKAKDAVVDRFNSEIGSRPSIDTKTPDIGIHLYYDSGHLDVYLDSSGYSLHKRGYKRFLGQASLNETLAAAIFRWGEWKPGQVVVNPMCGIGTIGIEATFTMHQLSPQQNRDNFGFRHWHNYDDEIYQELRKQQEIINDLDVLCSDINSRAVDECRQNVDNAGLSDHIHCDTEDFFTMDPIDNALILLNPPYDIRLRQDDVIAFYKKIGDTLKFKWKNSRCVVISGNLEAFKFIGLRPNKKYKVFNGPIPAEIRIYDIY